MRWTTRAMMLGLSFSLLLTPAAADVIPTRVEEDSPQTAQTFVDRLASLGIPAAEARDHAASLTPETLAHYASGPNALHFVGQQGPDEGTEFFSGQSHALWYETVGGIFTLVLAAGVIAFAVVNGG